jgi:hypothetical protein
MNKDETNATPTAAATGLTIINLLAIRNNLHSYKIPDKNSTGVSITTPQRL